MICKASTCGVKIRVKLEELRDRVHTSLITSYFVPKPAFTLRAMAPCLPMLVPGALFPDVPPSLLLELGCARQLLLWRWWQTSPSSGLAPGTVQRAAVICEAGQEERGNKEKSVINNNNNNFKKNQSNSPSPLCFSLPPAFLLM